MTGNKVVTATFAQNQYTLTINIVGSGSVGKSPDQTTYTWGTNVSLTASAGVGWSFANWSGDASGTVSPTVVNMTGNKVVTATFAQNQYTLTINIVGSGSVGKSPDQATYAYGTNVSLTANAGVGWSFANWTGDAFGTVSPTVVNMTGNKVVTATFTPNQYTLTVNIVGNGSVGMSPNGSSSKPANSIWLEPSTIPLMGKTAGYRFNVTAWINLNTPSFLWQFKYTFDPAHFKVTRSDYTGAGKSLFFTGLATVPVGALIDNVAGSILCGESLQGPIQRAAGSDSIQWIEFEVIAPSTEEQFTNIPGDTYVLGPGPDFNDIAVTKYGALASWNISSSEAATYVYGTNVTLTANAAVGWSFANWTGDASGSDSPIVVNMTSNKVVTATFTQNQYTLTVNVVGSGSVGKNPDLTTYTHGTNVTLNATAQPGWVFSSWSGDQTGSANPVTLTMNSDKVVTATFTEVGAEIHDVAITNVTSSKHGCLPIPTVCRGYTANLFVTVENLGNFTETLSIHAYVNSTAGQLLVGTQNVTLSSGNSAVVTFVWNTTGLATGNYTVHAEVDAVPGESSVENNMLYDGAILVSILGDITGPAGRPDGKVDMWDIGNVARRFMAAPPSPDYNKNFDINDDGIINMFDIALVARHFYEHEP
jgi:uncharacterized repeat protein (TIGR02543 family)